MKANRELTQVKAGCQEFGALSRIKITRTVESLSPVPEPVEGPVKQGAGKSFTPLNHYGSF